MLIKFNKIVDNICNKVSYASLGALLFLMCVTGVHVLLRKFTPISVPDSIGLTELSMVVIVFCTMGYLQTTNGHVRVDMFIEKLPFRGSAFITCAVLVIGAVILFLMFYASVLQIPIQYESHLATSVLRIQIWPFYIVMCIGLFLYGLSLALHAAIAFCDGVKGIDKDAGETAAADTGL